MENEIQATQSTVPQVKTAQTSFGDVVQKDLTLPRILLSQMISDRVKDGRAKPGDFILSGNDMIVAEREKEFNFIPIKMRAVWVNYEMTTKRGVFKGSEIRNNANSDLPWTYTDKDGKPMKRVQGIELYGVLPSQVIAYNEAIKKANETGDLPDLDNVVSPLGMSFQSMSFKFGGKQVAEFFTRIQQASMSIPSIRPYSYVLSIKSAMESKDDDEFFVSKVVGTKKLTEAYPEAHEGLFQEASNWSRLLNSANVTMEAEQEDVGSSSGPASDLV